MMARSTPMAGGQPISGKVADEAAAWVTLMMSPDVTQADHLRLQAWRDAHADHERAWQHVEAVSARMRRLDHSATRALSAVTAQPSSSRRRATLALICLSIAGATGMAGTRTQFWQQANAQYRTGIGELREWVLEDGTRLTLNTDSAVNVAYTDDARYVTLIAGEVMVQTGYLPRDGMAETRPFAVVTGRGVVEALGTRFTVREQDQEIVVVVLEHRVRIVPAANNQPAIVHAGQQTSFTSTGIGVLAPAEPLSSAWTKRQLIAVDMRLSDFVAELGRYRTGIVHCDPAVADMRFSGVFPLNDPEQVLMMLPGSLPVQLHMRTRYWITIAPAAS